MSDFSRRLALDCEIREEVNTLNDLGEPDREFGEPVMAKCRIDANRNTNNNDLQLGQVTQHSPWTLFLGPEVNITTAHKVTVRGRDYKVVHVRDYFDFQGNPHHFECDLQGWE